MAGSTRDDLLRIFCLAAAAAVLLACAGSGDDPADVLPADPAGGATLGYTTVNGQVKVLTFNTGHDWDPDANARYARLRILADFAKRRSVEIIVLQERDYRTDGTSDGEFLQSAFAEVGYPMSVVQVRELSNEANVIASKHPFVAGSYAEYLVGGERNRIIQRVAVQTPAGKLWVMNVHTHYKRPCKETIDILGAVKNPSHWFAPPAGEPVILMGDFNLRLEGEDRVVGVEYPGGDTALNAILAEAYLESALDPSRNTNFSSHIDWIISRNGPAMLHSGWVDNEVRDAVSTEPGGHPVILGMIYMGDAGAPTGPQRYENPDGVPDLLAIRKRPEGSTSTRVQVLASHQWLSEIWWNTATALHPTGANFEFGIGDWNRDGHLDLLAFKKWDTGQRRTEVHVLNGADGYASFACNIVTALHETGPEASLHAADWNRDRVPDLWYIKKYGTGSGRTEVHILDGAGWFQRFTGNIATALHPTGDEADFCVADWNRDGVPDLWYIKKCYTGSNRTEIHILDGASWFQRFSAHIATGLHVTGDEAEFVVSDWNRDRVPDLWYIKKYGTGTGRTEVHILSGASWFQSWLAHIGTGVEPTGADDAFVVTP